MIRRVLAVAALAACSSPSPVPRDRAEPVDDVAAEAPAPDRCRAAPFEPYVLGSDCASAGARNTDGSPRQLGPAPPGEPGRWVLFGYDAFGPQALAHELLGMAWWSWEGGGSWERCDAFDVRVVVYAEGDRAEVARRYPTIEDESDYRLVSRDDAVRFLDEAIADLTGDEAFDRLRGALQETRDTITRCLP